MYNEMVNEYKIRAIQIIQFGYKNIHTVFYTALKDILQINKYISFCGVYDQNSV